MDTNTVSCVAHGIKNNVCHQAISNICLSGPWDKCSLITFCLVLLQLFINLCIQVQHHLVRHSYISFTYEDNLVTTKTRLLSSAVCSFFFHDNSPFCSPILLSAPASCSCFASHLGLYFPSSWCKIPLLLTTSTNLWIFSPRMSFVLGWSLTKDFVNSPLPQHTYQFVGLAFLPQ